MEWYSDSRVFHFVIFFSIASQYYPIKAIQALSANRNTSSALINLRPLTKRNEYPIKFSHFFYSTQTIFLSTNWLQQPFFFFFLFAVTVMDAQRFTLWDKLLYIFAKRKWMMYLPTYPIKVFISKPKGYKINCYKSRYLKWHKLIG